MSDGAHTHDLSGAHVQDQLYYNLGPYGYSVTVIFIYVGKDQFYLFFVPTSLLVSTGVLEDEHNMTFKIPAGFSASFKLIEVATGAHPSNQGKYLVTMELHPSLGSTTMKSLSEEVSAKVFSLRKQNDGAIKIDELPDGMCPGNSQCPGMFGPCQLGQVLNEMCECVDPQGGG